MLKIYEDELKQLKKQMEKAEIFANKIPLFSEKIIKEKYTGEEQHLSFGEKYKDIYLAWGINRVHFNSTTNYTITNYSGEYDKYLFSIYVNSYNLYDSAENFDLDKLNDKCSIFFYDKWNNKFYIEDEHIEEFLEKLNKWYLDARNKAKNAIKQQKIERLKKELADLENNE